MTLSNMALKNLKRNYGFYSLCLFTVSFILMVFFCFLSFSKNQVIMDKISSDGRVETMCSVVAVFIIAFVIFYISYSNQFFIRRRMQELGIYTLLGYRKLTILKLLTLENIVICIGGMVIGIVFGGVLHKIVTGIITNLLGLAIDWKAIPLINGEAVSTSFIFIFVVFAMLTLSNSVILRKSCLLDLVGLEKKVEKPIKVYPVLGLLSIISLDGGYILAFDMVKGRDSVWYTIGFSPIALLTICLVSMGTMLFVFAFLPYFCQRLKQHKKVFFQQHTMIVVCKLMQNIRSNAKSLVVLILLVAGTLVVWGSTVLTVWYSVVSVERIIPSAIEFRINQEEELTTIVDVLNQSIGKENYTYQTTEIIPVTAYSTQLPVEYTMSEDKGREPRFECIRESDYLLLIEQQGKKPEIRGIEEDECILIKYRPDKTNSSIGDTYILKVEETNEMEVTVIGTTLQNPIGFANTVGNLVISDTLYQRMVDQGAEVFSIVSINGRELRGSKEAYEAVYSVIPDNMYLASAYERESEIIHANSSTLLLIGFASVIFTIAIGSVMYFQNVSAVAYDYNDYMILEKMGYSREQIKRVSGMQIKIYFLIPYLLGMIHSIFALITYKNALMDDMFGKNSMIVMPITLAFVIFSIVYFVYYKVTKYTCYRIIWKQVNR